MDESGRYGGLTLVERVEAGEAVHRRAGERPEPPGLNIKQGPDVERIEPNPALAVRHKEVSPFEHAEMLHHRASVEFWKLGAKLCGRSRTHPEQVKNLAPTRIGEGSEGQIEGSIRLDKGA